MSRLTPDQLRSARWFAPDDLRSFGHRSRAKQMGYAREDFTGKPVIGILNTWSDLNTCHTHFRQRAEEVKRGVWQAGGFPLEVPIMTLSETYMKPTSMYYRNLVALEVEETLRCYPLDGAVLMGGCDKTVPALIMGATSMNLPSIFLPAGPMMKGCWHGETLGSGSDVWKYWAERQAGNFCEDSWNELEDGIARSPGTCMTMGTASTMSAIAETLGLCLPGACSIPAVHSAHQRLATACGRRIVDLVWENVRPRDLLTEEAFQNAIVADMALGGSTNAIVHLIAMAGRAGITLPLERFDEISRRIKVLANLRPCGEYLMEDFHDAGGLPALLEQIRGDLHLDCLTVSGQTLGENISGAKVYHPEVIRPPDRPVGKAGGTFILKGNLCPDGAVIKPTAAEAHLLKHRGLAAVFEDYADLKKRIDDPALGLTADHIIVLKNAGPIGAPGIPEWGMLPIPKYLLQQGVRDMIRISDARMSGTSYGACVLHVAPESAVGGPLAFVQSGDWIELDVEGRRLHLDVSDAELERRRADWVPPATKFTRGYGRLYAEEITQANEGCDFRFLHHGQDAPEPDIY
ncbi:MAG: L-arabinonate dehydratase [Verrucomicrobiales bacterium]|nr:dihydroxy-acid dehydratase [Verrucomicrobiae bacterium]MCP5554958.1 dihydroxy-acid dehydratase [Akkermansiaceae bacterium]